MSGDYSRISFDPWHDFCAVLMQQGKVQLDSDWNEWVAIVERRLRVGTMDTIGKAAVPRETPDGFRIQAVGGALRILPGRIYVDGILAENHGTGAVTWDEHLAELRASDPVDYTEQPYFPAPPALPAAGRHAVYIDVWQREVDHLLQPDLIEKAVGVDTATRLQTVWQVKLWPNVGPDVTCATALGDLPGWDAANQPSGGRLTTAAQNNPGPDNPCLAPPTAGFTGLENQLYRVEIHTQGPGQARFKWSRDNGSVAARVLSITGNTRLVVDSVGKDALLRFSDGDWVEITDDQRELSGLSGEIRRIKLGGGVDDASRTIVLDSALPAGAFPVDAQNNTQSARHTRIRRWDQKGKVLRADGSVYHDLDAPGSDGLIPVPPAGTQLVVELGVLAEFSVIAGGQFKRLDHWLFAARSADASVETLDHAPPRAIHHHYAKLAIVTFPDAETDCRTLWPPLAEAGEGCACTVCVRAEDHNSGKATLQQAIDAVAPHGGTVCVEPGVYQLREPLTIAQCAGVRLRGHGVASVIVGAASGSLIRVSAAQACAIEDLALIGAATDGAAEVVSVTNVVGLELRQLYALSLGRGDGIDRVIGLSSVAVAVTIADCALFGQEAIGFGGGEAKYLLGADVAIENNQLLATRSAIHFDGAMLWASQLRIRGNTVLGARDAGIVVGGASARGANVRVEDNTVHVSGTAIAVAASDATIAGNSCVATGDGKGDGIRLQPGLVPTGLRRVHILANRVLDAPAVAIRIATPIQSGMIKQNFIEGAGLAGISVEAGGASDRLSIENNALADIATQADAEGEVYSGVRVLRAGRVDIRANGIHRVGRNAARARAVAGIAVLSAEQLSVSANQLSGIGARDGFVNNADGILLLSPQLSADVSGNNVQRRAPDDTKLGDGRWSGIRIPGGSEQKELAFVTKTAVLAAALRPSLASVVFLGDRVLEAPHAPRDVTVRGNHVQGASSRTPYLWIADTRGAVVAENQVSVAENSPVFAPLVALQAGSYTVQANIVRALGDLPSMQIDGPNAVVIGNLTTSKISLGGQPLAAPFDVLNMVIP